MMRLQSLLRHRLVFFVWLALLLSIGVTGDLIVDLVFEDPAHTAPLPNPAPEEPDNAAEHILIPSERSQGPDTVLAASSDNPPLVAIQEPPFAISLPYVLVRLDHPLPRNLPLSFLTPLRI